MHSRTRHFKNCLGVFQGGGCKALAFVGAFEEAVSRGVFFSQLCGTSAGSVIAALVAAGATPEFLKSTIAKLDFTKFKQPPDIKLFGHANYLLAKIVSLHRFGRIYRNLGAYSSHYLEEWLQGTLASLLEVEGNRTIRFRDLNVPLYVVATQLGSTEPKVWSTEATPEDSVAYAVRCSCSIPGFFQPVDGLFVDGGVVSNLPAFVLQPNAADGYEKVLCFGFESLPVPHTIGRLAKRSDLTPKKYLAELASAAVDGSLSIQIGLQQNLHTVAITDLPLGTVDFDRVNSLTIEAMFACGRKAAAQFFDVESLNLKREHSQRKLLLTQPATLNQIARHESSAEEEIVLSLETNRLVYTLFPTLLRWSQAGAAITFIAPQHPLNKDRPHEELRNLILRGLGIRVVAPKREIFNGFFVRRRGVAESAIVLINEAPSGHKVAHAKPYDRICDESALYLMWKALDECVAEGNVLSDHHRLGVRLISQSDDTLVQRLREISQYRSASISIQVEEVELHRLIFLSRYIKSYKYTQIRGLFDFANNNGYNLLQNLWMEYRLDIVRGFVMPVTLPVVEEHGGKLFVLEGNSRLTHIIRETDNRRAVVAVVRGVEAPLPSSSRFSNKQVIISDEYRYGETRYKDFDLSSFRPIEEKVRDPKYYTGMNA